MFYIYLAAIGINEALIVLLIILVLFGGRKIPELMKGLGKGMKEFKNATTDDESINSEKES
ncbi:MAG: twin-arginine translocase TatA/TatE family subunit [Marinifilaceae bacterium]|jgi:sec-independent protein translocase protein TatA|nr:twin-arginine translocase TatA/TatE family subunit [Marinifilaceae bacterium]